MPSHRTPFHALMVGLIAATSAGMLASCAPANRAPETVSVSNPSVTYKYRGDQELLRANQQAAVYCNQYGSTPRTVNLTNNTDGTNTVIFDCVKVAAPMTAVSPMPPLPPSNPALMYTYRNDRELLDSSRRADAYCMQYGQRMVATSSIVTNADGTRTISYQCGPTIAIVP